jgi:hypothetical protein
VGTIGGIGLTLMSPGRLLPSFPFPWAPGCLWGEVPDTYKLDPAGVSASHGVFGSLAGSAGGNNVVLFDTTEPETVNTQATWCRK